MKIQRSTLKKLAPKVSLPKPKVPTKLKTGFDTVSKFAAKRGVDSFQDIRRKMSKSVAPDFKAMLKGLRRQDDSGVRGAVQRIADRLKLVLGDLAKRTGLQAVNDLGRQIVRPDFSLDSRRDFGELRTATVAQLCRNYTPTGRINDPDPSIRA